MNILEIENLRVAVQDKEIIKGLSLSIPAGQVHAIMGPNGSGKSTTAYSIAGHPKYTVTGGEVLLDGENVLEMSVDERARAGLFLAMQYPVEVPGVSVSNFLRTSATAVRGEAPNLRTWIKEMKDAMSDLQIDPAFAERSVNEGFSGGERKRAALALAFSLQPDLLLLDEPVAGMSPRERELTADLLRTISLGKSLVVIEHDMDFVKSIASKVTVLHQGRLLSEGTIEQVQKDPRVIDVYLGH